MYEETHTTNTDANGFVIVNIGEGTTSDNFRDIEWENETFSLNVQVNTGSGFVDLGTSKFKHVPYSYYSKKAGIAENVSGLEARNEGNGIGWRLIWLCQNLMILWHVREHQAEHLYCKKSN